jgi:type IV secretion system protein VirB9
VKACFPELLASVWLMGAVPALAQSPEIARPDPLAIPDDPRVRDVSYAPNTVYRLNGRAGYQIDIEFEAGERYLGLAAGDVNGLSFEAQDNHVFIKPKAGGVATNVTVLTDRRHYYFEYTVSPNRATVTPASDTLFALRFRYPQDTARQAERKATDERLTHVLDSPIQPLNRHYGYCGSRALRPTAAFDDGVRTHLAFSERAELPAVYVKNEDDTESLVNFTVTPDGLTVQRVARRFILRRGALKGCVVNEAFDGSGARLPTETVSTDVHRDTSTVSP